VPNEIRTIIAADLQERPPPRSTPDGPQPRDKCDHSGGSSEMKSCCWETGECRAFVSCHGWQSEVTFAAGRRWVD
jgi:hypothetical protein